MLKKFTFCASLFLAACGGGGDDSASGTHSDKNFVEGSFKDARVAGVAYPNSLAGAAVGNFGRACFNEHNYFETADGRIQVYGSTAFSETDFEVVATMVSERLDVALDKFGLTWDEFVAQRELVNMGALGGVIRMYSDYQSYPEYFDDSIGASDQGPTAGETTSTATASDDPYSEDKAQWAAWSALSTDEQNAFIREIYVNHATAPEHDTVAEKDVLLSTDKVQVCFNGQMGGSMFGEGSQVGIQVPPNTSTYHSRVGEIFTHELVHFIQDNIANVGQNPYGLMPRWFTEGQAVFMSGQSVASVDHHYNFDPVQILGFYDEMDSGVDASTAYEHYGLAYKYIQDSNGRDTVIRMMQALKTNTDAPQVGMSAFDTFDPDRQYDEGRAFTRGFETFMKDHTGAPLTIEQYRTNYHDLMNSWK